MRLNTRVLLTVGVLAFALAPVLAQQPPVDGFVPVAPGDLQTEQIPAAGLVMTAYAIVWAALALYVWSVWQRVIKVETDLRDVTARLEGRR